MRTTLTDCTETPGARRASRVIENVEDLRAELARRRDEAPGTMDLTTTTGDAMRLGVLRTVGYAMTSGRGGGPPYHWTLGDAATSRATNALDEVEFPMDGDTLAVAWRNCVPIDVLFAIAEHFYRTSRRSTEVEWEEQR